jgi:hypothetical protein
MIKKKIRIPIFEAALTVILDKDLSYVQKTYNTSSLVEYGAITMRDPNAFKHYIIAFESKDNGLIAHEVVHAINYLFLDVGVELDRENDETQAYLTGWMFDQVYKVLNKNIQPN